MRDEVKVGKMMDRAINRFNGHRTGLKVTNESEPTNHFKPSKEVIILRNVGWMIIFTGFLAKDDG